MARRMQKQPLALGWTLVDDKKSSNPAEQNNSVFSFSTPCCEMSHTGYNFGTMEASDDEGLCTVHVCFPCWKQNLSNNDEVTR